MSEIIEIKGIRNTLQIDLMSPAIDLRILGINGAVITDVHVSRAELIKALWPEGVEALTLQNQPGLHYGVAEKIKSALAMLEE